MLRYKTKLYTILLILLCSSTLQRQDFTFSQFYHTNFIYNPALTGHIAGSYRLALLTRSQWADIDGGFKNHAFVGDFNRFNYGKTKLGLGIAILQDESFGGKLKSNNVLVSSALHQQIGDDERYYVSFGFQGGMLTRRYNTTDLKFASGLLGGVNEIIVNPTTTHFDLRAGINWTSYLNKRFSFKMGAAYLHLGGIKETVISRVSTIAPTVVAHGDAEWHVFPERLLLMPSFLIMAQGGARQYNFGSTVFYKVGSKSKKKKKKKGEDAPNVTEDKSWQNLNIFAGLHWRVGDAIIPSVGLEYRTIRATFSYDGTLSALGQHSGYEFSIGYNGQLARTRHYEDPDKIDDLLLNGL